MFHLEMYSSSIATGINTFAQVTSVYSGVVPRLVNGFQVPRELPNLMGLAGVSANFGHLRYQAPSILPFPYPTFDPNNRGSGFESPPRFWDFSLNPYPLNPTEELDVFATQNSGGNQTVYVAALFTDNVRTPVPSGPMLSVHWTATTTLTAAGFTAVAPAFDQALKAGTYALVGCRVFSATSLFFQMLPVSGPVWRPGGICVNAYDQMDPFNQRGMQQLAYPGQGWGTWLTFAQNVPPSVNVFATAADTAEEGFYDLVYLGGP